MSGNDGSGGGGGSGGGDSIGTRLFGDVSPRLGELTDELVFGEIWQRPGLSQRERSLITIAMLLAAGESGKLVGHTARGLRNGVTEEALQELVLHAAIYAGWPRAQAAVESVRTALREHGAGERQEQPS